VGGQTLHVTEGVGLVVNRDGTTWLDPVTDEEYAAANGHKGQQ
jgi:hypothetical protein